MRFANDIFKEEMPESLRHYNHVINKPVVPSFNPEDLIRTPEMQPGPYYPGQDIQRDKYIRNNPRSGVS